MKHSLAAALACALLFSSACTQSSQKLVETANKYHAKGKFKEASILYQKAINKDKKNAEAYYRQGLNLLDQQEPVEAAKYLRRAVDQNPNNVDAEIKLAEIYFSAYSSNPQKFKTLLPEVRELTAKILQHQPESLRGARLQALLYLVDNNVDKAVETFAEANRKNPHSRELVGGYAETLVHANRSVDANALMRDMLNHDPRWGPGYDFLFLEYSREKDPAKAEAVLRDRFAHDPSNAIAVRNLANYLLEENHFDEAEGIMRRVLDDKKQFPNGREMMGDFYTRAKKYDLALQQYQAGAKDDEKSAALYQERVVAIYAITGRRDEALSMAQTLAAKEPKNVSVNDMYGSLLVDAGLKKNQKISLDALKGLVQNNPKDAALHFDLARADFAMGDFDKALGEALESVSERPSLNPARTVAGRIYEDRGQHAKALEQTDAILASEPKNADARLIRGRALIGLGEADKARPELEALVQEFPQVNDARLALADLYLSDREFDKAAEEFDHLWKSTPPDIRGFLGLQNVKLAQGKAGDAIAALQDLVQKNPSLPAYRYRLANAEVAAAGQVAPTDTGRQKQLLQQAADNYKEILKTAAKSPDPWIRLGLAQRELGQSDAALASFEQAGNLDPHNATAFLNQGVLLDTLGKKKEAADAYNRVLAIEPSDPTALNNLAFLNAETGANLDQAMSFAERAKKEAPHSPDISDTLGYVYYQKNLNGEALGIFRQLVQDNPNNPMFHLHLAMALLKQGDKQSAREEAERALKNARPDQQNRIHAFVHQIG